MNMKNKTIFNQDALIILLFIISVFSWFVNKENANPLSIFRHSSIWIIYIIFRFIQYRYVNIDCIMIIVVSLICLYESLLGIFQIFSYTRTEYLVHPCMGTFNNPGPYAGFLVTCMSIMIAYLLQHAQNFAKIIIVIGLVPSLVVLPVTLSRAAFIALVFSMLLLFMSIPQYNIKIKKKYLIFIFALVILGVIAYFFKQNSANGRLLIFIISLRLLRKFGLFGCGYGNFASVYGQEQADYFLEYIEQSPNGLDYTLIPSWEREVADMPQYAFNEFIHRGVEIGVLYMLVLLMLLLMVIIQAYRARKIWCYGLVSIFMFSLFSYPLEYWENILLFPIILALCNVNPNKQYSCINIAYLCMFIVYTYILLSKIYPFFKEQKNISSYMERVYYWYNINKYDLVIEDCENIGIRNDMDDFYYYVYGISLQKAEQYEKSNKILIVGAQKSNNPAFWNAIGSNYLALKEYDMAESYYRHAFCMIPNRLIPLYNLTKLYYYKGDMTNFNEMINLTLSFSPKIESDITKNLRLELELLTKEVN